MNKKDFEKIVKAHKEIFATKEEILEFRDEMRTNFSDLQTSVDNYAQKADT